MMAEQTANYAYIKFIYCLPNNANPYSSFLAPLSVLKIVEG